MSKRKTKRDEAAADRISIGIKIEMLTAINKKLTENPALPCRIPGNECSISTVRNHSIQEEGVLSEIAEVKGTERSVKKLTWDLLELANRTKPNDGLPGSLLPGQIDRMEPRDVLIGDASLMYVACSSDDGKTFDKIEPGLGLLPDFKDSETLFQFSWRGFLYRICEIELTRSALLDFRTKALQQRNWDKRMLLEITGRALTKIEKIHDRLRDYEEFFWNCYSNQKFDEVQHIVKHIPSRPAVAASEFADLVSHQSEKMICAGLTVYPYSGGHYIVVSFLRSESSFAQGWVDSLSHVLNGDQVKAGEFLTQQLMSDYRNVYISPLLYRSLTSLQREAVEKHLAKQWLRLTNPGWRMPDFVQSEDGRLNFFSQCQAVWPK